MAGPPPHRLAGEVIADDHNDRVVATAARRAGIDRAGRDAEERSDLEGGVSVLLAVDVDHGRWMLPGVGGLGDGDVGEAVVLQRGGRLCREAAGVGAIFDEDSRLLRGRGRSWRWRCRARRRGGEARCWRGDAARRAGRGRRWGGKRSGSGRGFQLWRRRWGDASAGDAGGRGRLGWLGDGWRRWHLRRLSADGRRWLTGPWRHHLVEDLLDLGPVGDGVVGLAGYPVVVDGGAERIAPDVRAVNLRAELGQRQDVGRREVGADGVGQLVEQRRRLGDQVELDSLIAEGTQHLLLAQAAGEVVVVVARARVLEGGGAVHMLQAGGEVDAGVVVAGAGVLVVLNRGRNVDRHAAERVDDLDKALEVDFSKVVDRDTEVVLNGGADEAGAGVLRGRAEGIGGVDLVTAETGDRDQQVAGDREHRDIFGDRVNRDNDDGVGAGRAFVRRPLPLVDTEQQDVDPLGAVPVRQGGGGLAGLGCHEAQFRRALGVDDDGCAGHRGDEDLVEGVAGGPRQPDGIGRDSEDSDEAERENDASAPAWAAGWQRRRRGDGLG